MAHTYYTRLTLVHPQAVSRLDPRLGVVIAETATTGRFILSDITWESVVGPNAQTTVAYHGSGDLKIIEPLGMSLFDYIRAAAFEVGIENHIDARFLLEVEILAENFLQEKKQDSPYKYVWPIMLIASQAQSSLTEKGTEYNIKFIHTGGHAQTDLVQPIKETLTVENVRNLKDYFEKLQNLLEEREYQYAAARQKAGKNKSPGGNNPAKQDDYHDEYHFILEPDLESPKYVLSTLGKADKAISGSWTLKNLLPGATYWDIPIRPGTTIMSQITEVMKRVKDVSDLLPGRPKPVPADASGSSQQTADSIKGMLSNVYKFFRVETHSVYKAYDYIRARYAVKHVFFIYLADQPNMYQYPDEIDLLNKLSNKERVELKLKYYIQEGLLQKIYYYNYTGLNTDILKVDLQFNQSYSLPSFTQIWADRGQTGSGAMNLENYSRRVSPFVHRDDKGVRNAIADLQSARERAATLAKGMLNDRGQLKDSSALQKTQYKQLQEAIRKYDEELVKRKQELATISIPETPLNTIKSRSDLLSSLKGSYAEDIDFTYILKKQQEADFPSLRPRMEIDRISESVENVKNENERLMEKIFAVQTSPRDLQELDLDIIADPFWLGVPNMLLQGKADLDKIEFPAKTAAAIKQKLNTVMPNIDPYWNKKTPTWGNYGVAQWYKGSPLLYFNTQVPDSEITDSDMLSFRSNDQVVGIYMVKQVINEFKNGLWVQKLKTVRDPTIPSHALPRGLTGEMTFENYMNRVEESPDRAIDKINELKKEEQKARDREKGTNNMAPVPGTEPPTKTSLSPKMSSALSTQKELLAANPPPEVLDPVANAKAMMAADPNMTKQQAYKAASTQYEAQVNAFTQHMETINRQAFKESNISTHEPYDAKTMAALAIERSNNGGLEAWKFSSSIGNSTNGIDTPAKSNNPAGIGYDSDTKKFYRYSSFTDGMKAANDYFNYGDGVKQVGVQGADRLLLPSENKTNQLAYIKDKLKGGK